MTAAVVHRDVIAEAVRLACRAPSLHNSQPWRWVVEGDDLHLFADPDRAVRGADSSGRAAVISCGVVLHHLGAAMAVAGWAAEVDRFPDPRHLEHLATITFAPRRFVTADDRRRADAILLRRTDRLPFAVPPSWDSVESRLRHVVDADMVHFDVIVDELRPQLVDASQLTESLRLYDSSYHAELDWWTSSFEFSDGIPHSSLVSAAESDRVGVGRTFPVTHHRLRRAQLDADQAKVIVLSTADDGPDGVLQCGEMLSAVLLEATTAGLATCTLTHITEVPASRDIVAGLIGQNTIPQVLIRIGVVPSLDDTPPPTPRRPLRDVLHIAPTAGRNANR